MLHLNKRDVDMIGFSAGRQIDRLTAYRGTDVLGVPIRVDLRHRLPGISGGR